MVGQWRSDSDGTIVEWEDNPEYRPSPEALGWPEPADDIDRAIQLATTGYAPAEAVTAALSGAEVAVLVTADGEPVRASAPDGTPVVLAYTSDRYLHAAGRLSFAHLPVSTLLTRVPRPRPLPQQQRPGRHGAADGRPRRTAGRGNTAGMTGSHPLPNDATGIPGGCFLTEQYSQVSLLCQIPPTFWSLTLAQPRHGRGQGDHGDPGPGPLRSPGLDFAERQWSKKHAEHFREYADRRCSPCGGGARSGP